MSANLITSPKNYPPGYQLKTQVHKQELDIVDTKTMPNDLQNLIKKLDFLAMIKQNYKIDTKNNVLFDNNSWAINNWIKWWNRKAEDRFTTIDFIKKTIDETMFAISKYENTEFLRYIINSLSSARIGISKSEITYRNDQNFISDLSVIFKNIDIPLENYKHLIIGCN